MAQREPLYHINRHKIDHISEMLIHASAPERTMIFEKAYKVLTATEKKMILEWLVNDFKLVVQKAVSEYSSASEKVDE